MTVSLLAGLHIQHWLDLPGEKLEDDSNKNGGEKNTS